MKETLFKQAWWVTLAVVLAALQVVFAVGIGTDSEEIALWRIVFFIGWAAGAALVVVGARLRQQQQAKGDALIALGVIPSIGTSIVAFWLPPMWVVGAAGLIVIWLSLRDAYDPTEVGAAQSTV